MKNHFSEPSAHHFGAVPKNTRNIVISSVFYRPQPTAMRLPPQTPLNFLKKV